MNLLDHPLIQKYFGCTHDGTEHWPSCRSDRALRVIEAMQEPIQLLERYLHCACICHENESIGHTDYCEDKCGKSKDPIEEKIKHILSMDDSSLFPYNSVSFDKKYLEYKLRDLVKIAQENAE